MTGKHSFILSGLIIVVFILLNPAKASANITVEFQPAQNKGKLNETSQISVYLNPRSIELSRISLVLTYPKERMVIQSINTSDSFVQFWYQTRINAAESTITLEGGTSSPIKDTKPVKVAEINLVSIKEGKAEIGVSNNSKVYARNGDELGMSFDSKALIAVSPQITSQPAASVQALPTDIIQTPSPEMSQPPSQVESGVNIYTPTIITSITAFLLALFILKRSAQ